MKILIILGILLLLFAGFQLYTSYSTAKTEEQKCETVKEIGDVEIRYYPPAILATTWAKGEYKDMSRAGFRTLASYIFGQNSNSEKIAMTTPVHMSMGDDSSSMSFVMPSEYDLDKLPDPQNNKIKLHKEKEKYVACLSFSGFSDDEKIETYSKKLLKAVENAGLKHKGKVSYLGYNPPYQMVGRRNEVQVELIDFNRE